MATTAPKTHKGLGKRKASDLEVGDDANTKSFVVLHKLEGRIGAYCGYLNRDEFRAFAMSAFVLRPYVSAWTDRAKIQVRQDRVLAYIRDHPSEMQSEDDPIRKYPTQNDGTHALKRMSLAVCQLRRRIQETVLGGGPPRYTQQDQDNVQAEFHALTGSQPPAVKIAEVVVKDIGPHTDYGECDLEAINRCWNLLMYVNYSLSNKCWAPRFGSSKWLDKFQFLEEHKPDWMQEHVRQQQSPATPPSPSPVPRRRVKVVWHRPIAALWSLELMQFLEEQGMDDAAREGEIEVAADASPEHVRDAVRVCFNMDEIGAQIKGFATLPKLYSVWTTDWRDFREELFDENTSIRVTLRRAADNEFIWETRDLHSGV